MRTSWYLCLGFLAVRLLSFGLYFFVPEAIRTDIGTLISGVIIALLFFLYKKSPLLGLFLVLTEFTLGGAGHYLEFFGLALRTCLLLTYLSLFFLFERKNIDITVFSRSFRIGSGVFFLSLVLGVCIGYKNNHPSIFILQDALPFLFLCLVFPLMSHWEKIYTSAYSQVLIKIFIWGNTAFSALTLALFSFGIVHIREPYYTWFRDVAMGKITDMGTGFFRIVLPEHLLLVPILLIILARIISQKKNDVYRLLYLAIIVIITINFSRIYLLAILVAYGCLIKKNHLKKWLSEGIILLFTLWITFSSLHLIASQFTSFGSELFTSRAKSLVQPDSELSSATRMTLLPPIIEQIQMSPIFGSGLGNTVQYADPITQQEKTTRQYDWGYLELWAELGLAGLGALLFLIVFLVRNIYQLFPGAASALATLAIINLTAPVFTHVFGLVCLAIFTCYLTQKKVYLPVIDRSSISS